MFGTRIGLREDVVHSLYSTEEWIHAFIFLFKNLSENIILFGNEMVKSKPDSLC